MRPAHLVVVCLILLLTVHVGGAPNTNVDELRQSADGGDAAAALEMGRRLEEGRGVMQNDMLAAKYYAKSADAANAEAMFFLGRLCADGKGVAKNPAKALELFQKSSDAGFARAD